ncbi:hypothetical protein D3C77_348920 [compost metagenome]
MRGAFQLGRIGFRVRQNALQLGRQLQPQARAAEALGHRTQAVEGVRVGRGLDGDLIDGLVLQDAAARLVALLGRALAPDSGRDEGGQVLGVVLLRLQPLPGVLGRGVVERRIGDRAHFRHDPVQAAFLFQPVAQLGIEGRQVRHVAHGIGQLGVAERTARPVGEAAALVQLLAQHLADQGLITDLIAEAGGHGRHLGVEQRARHGAQLVEDLHVLPGGVEDLENRFVAQDVEEGRQIQPLGHRVDDGGVRRRSRRLDQAQLGPVGGFPHEFRINGDVRGLGQTLAEGDQRVIGGDWRHSDAIAPRDAVVARAPRHIFAPDFEP